MLFLPDQCCLFAPTIPNMTISSASFSTGPVGPDSIVDASDRLLTWLDNVGYDSCDPYDIWGTPYGLWSRKVYYAKGWLGVPLVAPLVLMDLICPALRVGFVGRSRFATADAQFLLAFLNPHEITGEERYLERAIALGDELFDYSIPGYSGPCWGYPFHWRINKDEVWLEHPVYHLHAVLL